MTDKYFSDQTSLLESGDFIGSLEPQTGEIAVYLEHTQNFLSNSKDLAMPYAFLLPQLVNPTFLQLISATAPHKT